MIAQPDRKPLTLSEYIRTKGGEEFFEPSLGLPTPTGASPGSKEKIEVMRQRLEQGFELWSPLDNHACVTARENAHNEWSLRRIHPTPAPKTCRKAILE